jgi:hypothetical protein
MTIFRQSTAVDTLIGPFLDVTDGVTAETGETPAIKLSKTGQTLAAKNDVTVPAHDADGYYNCELDATDTNTVGELVITAVGTATALPVRHEHQVIDAIAYDTLYADPPTIITPADVGLIYESAITTVTGQTEFIMTVPFAVDDSWIGSEVSLYDISTDEVYAGNIWISDAVQSTESLHINVAFPVTVVTGDVIRIYARQHASYALTAYDPPTSTEASNDTASILAKLLSYVRLLSRSDGFVDLDDAIALAEINADEGAGAGDYDPEVDSLEAQADVSSEIRLAELDAANLPTDVSTVSAATVAIQAKTDSLTFTTAGNVDANIVKVAAGGDIIAAGTGGQEYGET